MERQQNPYRPGFNRPPLVLAGREGILDAADEALQIAALDGSTPPPLLLVGARGVGKTVALGEIAARAAETHGWPRLHVEVTATQPFTPQILRGSAEIVSQLSPPRRGERIRASEASMRATLPGLSGEVRFQREPATTSGPQLALSDDLRTLASELLAHNLGAIITIDEAQQADHNEMTAFAAVIQEGTGKNWPIVLAIAGLRSMRDHRRSPSYFERGDWYELGSLTPQATLQALTEPARTAGRPFDEDAALYLAQETGGYPYAVQLYGLHAWRASDGQRRITLSAAQTAAARASEQLERGLYAQRWTQASPREQEYLHALATLQATGEPMTGGGVARHLALNATRLSQYRARLIEKGTIVAEGETLSFAIPGLGDYILRHAPKDDPNA